MGRKGRALKAAKAASNTASSAIESSFGSYEPENKRRPNWQRELGPESTSTAGDDESGPVDSGEASGPVGKSETFQSG